MGLHCSFTAARGNLLRMNPWPSLNQAFMLIKQEEKQRQVNTFGNYIALMVNVPRNNAQSFRQSDKPGISVEFSYCHGKNHSREKCYKLIGYPVDHLLHPNNKGKKKPFTKFLQAIQNSQSQNKTPQAMQVCSADSSQSLAQNSSHLTTHIEALQTQMNSLIKCIQNPTSAGNTTQTNSFQFGSNFAGTVMSLMATSVLSCHM